MSHSNKSRASLAHSGVFIVRAFPTNDVPSELDPKAVLRVLVPDGTSAPERLLGSNCELVQMTTACFTGVLRNVPKKNQSQPDFLPSKLVVTVERNLRCTWRRILVLIGIKYRGNFGTIVRSAVQANIFEEIFVVWNETETGHDEGTKASSEFQYYSKQTCRVSRKDINYYSMQNAPLINIKEFESVHSLLEHMKGPAFVKIGMKMFAVELGAESVNLHSSQAVELLAEENAFVVVGAEADGTPQEVLDICDYLFEIPSMSACVNVCCAFMAVLTVIQLADAQVLNHSRCP